MQKLMMPSLLCLLFSDALSDHACVFLCVSMHLEAELLTHEEIPTHVQALPPCARQPGFRASPSFHSKVYATLVKTCAWRNTAHLHPLCAQRTSLRASDSPDKAQHRMSPPKLRIPIPSYTSYNTISPSYTPLPGVMTALALRTSLILVVEFHAVYRCTICGAQVDSVYYIYVYYIYVSLFIIYMSL